MTRPSPDQGRANRDRFGSDSDALIWASLVLPHPGEVGFPVVPTFGMLVLVKTGAKVDQMSAEDAAHRAEAEMQRIVARVAYLASQSWWT